MRPKLAAIAFGAAAVLACGVVRAGEFEPDFDAILEDKDRVLQTELEAAAEGDLKEFTVVTDDDVSALEVGDIYKNNTSFFKVVAIRSKGAGGGRFVVQRIGGRLDPGRKWNRVSGLGPLTVVSRETLLSRFLSGGVLMYPIAFLLLAVIIITLNSLWVYRGRKQCPPRFIEDARKAIAEGDVESLESAALRERGLFPNICRAMAADFNASTVKDIESRCESVAMQQITLLRTPLKGLNFIAAVAPLLGLLGTVIGMIMCFDSLAEEAASAGKSQAMAAGIKVALLTTAAGLTVAVPAILIYFIFNQRLNLLAARCEGLATEFLQGLARLKRSDDNPGTTPPADDHEEGEQ